MDKVRKSWKSGAKGKSKGRSNVKNWEEEPSGDPHQTNWQKLRSDTCTACEKAFQEYKRGKGKRRVQLGNGKSADFQWMTLLKKGPNGKDDIVPIRRLGMTRGKQTDPHPGKIHPLQKNQTIRREKKGDWLTNDFFWKAFCACLAKQGTTVTQKPEDVFAFMYNRDYRDWKREDKEKRGGVLYNIPKGWKRFACRVNNKYGDNAWMGEKAGAGEWAVSYHGTSYEGCVAIVQGGLKAGAAQAYQSSTDVRTGKPIGHGIYCTPSISTAEIYAKSRDGGGTAIDGKKVCFVLQCRVLPSAIKRCHDEDTNDSAYWVMNNATDIRPYAVLVKEVGT